METRICSKCKEEKPLGIENFPNAARKGKPIRLGTQCRECQRKRSREHYQNNKTDYIERSKLRSLEFKDEIRECRRDWSDKNREINRDKKRQYNSLPENREKANERSRRYRQTEEGRKKENARAQVNCGIKMGSITNPNKCSKCNEDGYSEAHHEDYDKPLEIVWLCKLCHEKIHYLNEGRKSS